MAALSEAATRIRSNAATFAASYQTVDSRNAFECEPADEALKPDPGSQKDFNVSNNPFAFTPGQLNKLLNPKSLSAFKALGGLKGLERGSRTDINSGWCQDKVRLQGTVSFGEATQIGHKDWLGLDGNGPLKPYSEPGAEKEAKGQFVDRIRGFKDNRLPERKADSILVLIWKAYNEKTLVLLTFAVVISLALGIYETVHGDSRVGCLQDVAICVAGIFIVATVGSINDWQKERQFIKLNKRSNNDMVKVMRSGKSIPISVYDVIVGDIVCLEPGDTVPADRIFISGHGVKCDESLATGESGTDQMKKTPATEVWYRLQDGAATTKLDPFIISGNKVLQGVGTFFEILVVAIISIVMAILKGLPLVVTPALAFATTRILKENNLVHMLRASKATGNATTICSDKTGTLTQNKMTVVAGTIGSEKEFITSHYRLEKANPPQAVLAEMPKQVRDLVRTSISLNSTAFEGEMNGVPEFIGSKTEVAMLNLAKDQLGLDNLAAERSSYEVKQVIPFDSSRKCTGIVIKLSSSLGGGYRLLVKGAAERMLPHACRTVQFTATEKDPFEVEHLSEEHRQHIRSIIEGYAQDSLRTIGMLYADYPSWPPPDANVLEEDPKMADFDSIFKDLTWVGVVGIYDPLRQDVVNAVAQCQKSGVVVRIVTGHEEVNTACAIARDYGILKDPNEQSGIIMEGPRFRTVNEQKIDEMLSKRRVLGRSCPERLRSRSTNFMAMTECGKRMLSKLASRKAMTRLSSVVAMTCTASLISPAAAQDLDSSGMDPGTDFKRFAMFLLQTTAGAGLAGVFQLAVNSAIKRGASQPTVDDPQRHCAVWHFAQSIMSGGVFYWFFEAANLELTAYSILTVSSVVSNAILACWIFWLSYFDFCAIAGIDRSLPWVSGALVSTLCLFINVAHGLSWLPLIFWVSIALTPPFVQIMRRMTRDRLRSGPVQELPSWA